MKPKLSNKNSILLLALILIYTVVVIGISGCATVLDRNSSSVTTGVVTAVVSNALVPVPGGALSAGLIAGGAMYMMCSSSDEPHCKAPEKTTTRGNNDR